MSHGSGHLPLDQLATALGTSQNQVKRWLRAGLIHSAVPDYELPEFDWSQIQVAGVILRLTSKGVTLPRIVRQFNRLNRWSADGHLAPSIGSGKTLVIRDAEGSPLDCTGQRWLDYENEVTIVSLAAHYDVDHWFGVGLEMEDAENWAEAEAAYSRALAIDPGDAVLHFNLGNVLIRLGDPGAAASQYRTALRLDPDLVEAANNLRAVGRK
jgi:tetratricopeptide (TPR) repeat protein